MPSSALSRATLAVFRERSAEAVAGRRWSARHDGDRFVRRGAELALRAVKADRSPAVPVAAGLGGEARGTARWRRSAAGARQLKTLAGDVAGCRVWGALRA